MKPDNLSITGKSEDGNQRKLNVVYRSDGIAVISIQFRHSYEYTVYLTQLQIAELAGSLIAHLGHHAPSPSMIEIGTALHKGLSPEASLEEYDVIDDNAGER